MATISENLETRIQKLLPKSTADVIGQSVLYTTRDFFRYVEGGRHITGNCDIESIDKPWRFYVPTIIWLLFKPSRFVVVLPCPASWDNEDTPIPRKQLEGILDRIERVLSKKCRRYKILLEGHEDPLRMR